MTSREITPRDQAFPTLEELQAALDAWVVEYNTARAAGGG
jgi:hypothetical protein